MKCDCGREIEKKMKKIVKRKCRRLSDERDARGKEKLWSSSMKVFCETNKEYEA
jgi:hypothetical protein